MGTVATGLSFTAHDAYQQGKRWLDLSSSGTLLALAPRTTSPFWTVYLSSNDGGSWAQTTAVTTPPTPPSGAEHQGNLYIDEDDIIHLVIHYRTASAGQDGIHVLRGHFNADHTSITWATNWRTILTTGGHSLHVYGFEFVVLKDPSNSRRTIAIAIQAFQSAVSRMDCKYGIYYWTTDTLDADLTTITNLLTPSTYDAGAWSSSSNQLGIDFERAWGSKATSATPDIYLTYSSSADSTMYARRLTYQAGSTWSMGGPFTIGSATGHGKSTTVFNGERWLGGNQAEELESRDPTLVSLTTYSRPDNSFANTSTADYSYNPYTGDVFYIMRDTSQNLRYRIFNWGSKTWGPLTTQTTTADINSWSTGIFVPRVQTRGFDILYVGSGGTTLEHIRLSAWDSTTHFIGSTQMSVTSGTSVSPAKPGGTVEGDLMIALVSHNQGSDTFTPPSGWTQIGYNGSNGSMAAYRKVAGPSEPANYTWSFSQTTSNATASIATIRGLVALQASNVKSTAAEENGTSLIVGSVSTTAPNSWLINILLGYFGSTRDLTPPAGTYKVAQHTTSSVWIHAYGMEKRPTAGATGTRTWTQNGTFNPEWWVALAYGTSAVSGFTGFGIPMRVT